MDRDKRPSPGTPPPMRPLLSRLPGPFLPPVHNRKPFRHPVYPLVRLKEKRKKMTIALGVLCSDGVVLGTDLEYTQQYAAMPGQKMFWLPEIIGAGYFVLIAVAGNPDSAKTFVDTLSVVLSDRFPDGAALLRDIKGAIRDGLRHMWLEHIDAAPANERSDLQCDLLIAVRAESGCHLFRTNRTMLVEEKFSACHGVGMYVARLLTDLLLGWGCSPTVELASQVIAYTIKAAKDHIQYVGKGSDIHILPQSGLAYSLLSPERKIVENHFDELFAGLRNLLACVDGTDVSVDQIESRLDGIKNSVLKLKEDQLNRVERRLRMKSRRSPTPSTPPDPQSTTTDQLRPQPSPELPEATDES